MENPYNLCKLEWTFKLELYENEHHKLLVNFTTLFAKLLFYFSRCINTTSKYTSDLSKAWKLTLQNWTENQQSWILCTMRIYSWSLSRLKNTKKWYSGAQYTNPTTGPPFMYCKVRQRYMMQLVSIKWNTKTYCELKHNA